MWKGVVRTWAMVALIPVVVGSSAAVVGLVRRTATESPRAAQATPPPTSLRPYVAGDTSAPTTPQPAIPAPDAPPPPGVDLVWVSESFRAQRFVAFDWSGVPRGVLALPAGSGEPHPSPSGRRLFSEGDHSTAVYRADGAQIGLFSNPPDSMSNWSWADDDDHLCGLVDETPTKDGGEEILFTDTVGRPPRSVGPVGPQIGQTAPALLYCSIARDLAIVTHMNMDHVTELIGVRLSTGATILRHAYPDPPPETDAHQPSGTRVVEEVVASPGGQLIAEMWGPGGVSPGTDWETRVREVSTWRTLATIPGSTEMFTGDGRRLVQAGGVVDWRSGRTVWSNPNWHPPVTIRPSSAEVIIAITPLPQAQPSRGTPVAVPDPDYYLITPAGDARIFVRAPATVLS
jgi:hypothetical protein